MRRTPIHKPEAFTRFELAVLIAVVAVVLGLLLPQSNPAKAKSPRISCINNLKQVGVAYRIWENDHGDRFPAMESVSKGGWSELLTNANQGYRCWTNYAIMADDMGQSPKVVLCPLDGREAAHTFTNFANTNLSYFVGVSADDDQPQSLLGGDRNLGAGIEPHDDYGFSPENGQGNDVSIQTNSRAGPVCWSLKMHSVGNKNGGGNILFGDGSAQECTSARFRDTYQKNATPTTNWPAGHVPSSPSFRVLFP